MHRQHLLIHLCKQYCSDGILLKYQTPLFHHDSLTTNLHQFVLQAMSEGIKQLLCERRSQGFQYIKSSEVSVVVLLYRRNQHVNLKGGNFYY